VRRSALKEKTEETRTAEAKTAKERTICTAAQETKAGLKTAVEKTIWERIKLPKPGSRSPRD
jgi:hypothetical protein